MAVEWGRRRNDMSVAASRTVLCAVDDSSHAPAVALAAAGIAEQLKARLVVVRADPRLEGTEDERDMARQALAEFMLEDMPAGLGYRQATDSRVLAGGDAAKAILGAAAAEQAGLIVMGTRGRGALTRAVLGSTARDVLRGASVPVAVVPPSDPEIATVVGARTVPRFGILLVPVDLTSDATSQLAVTGLLAPGSDHRPMLLHVTESGVDPMLAQQRMNSLGLAIPGGRGAKLLVLEGNVADAIIRVTQRDDVGLVILGRARDAAGKIACAVLEKSRAVVVVVP